MLRMENPLRIEHSVRQEEENATEDLYFFFFFLYKNLILESFRSRMKIFSLLKGLTYVTGAIFQGRFDDLE